MVDLPENESQKIQQNLSFTNVPLNLNNTEWSIEIHSVKASK